MKIFNRQKFFLYTSAFLLPFLSALCVTLYTGSIWEDGLITLRQAISWIDGHGLTYNPGERVHGFTSPLNVLLLAFCYKLFGAQDPLNAIYAYRGLSLACLGATGMWLVTIFRWAGYKSVLWGFLAVFFFSLDFKTMLFSTNGQEPAFTVFFLSSGMAAALCGRKKWRMGLLIMAIAGLQWNRPEGFIYASGLILGDLLRLPSGEKIKRFKEYLWIVPGSILLYLPWLVFVLSYYGSPVPNTIYAKGGTGTFAMIAAKMVSAPWEVAASAFAPVGFHAAFSLVISGFSALLVFCACGYCLFIGKNSLGKIAASTALAAYAYLCLVDAMSHNYPWPWPFPWYYPPLSFCVAIALVSALAELGTKDQSPPRWKKLGLTAIISAIAAMMLLFYVNDSTAIRKAQENVENGVRKPIGLWLRENALPDDTVYCECIGYIGFYSGAIINDYPGLTSKKNAAIRHKKQLDFYGFLTELHSTWLVLRFNEARDAEERGLLKDYVWVRDFATPSEISGEKEPQSSSFDSYFRVFKRKSIP